MRNKLTILIAFLLTLTTASVALSAGKGDAAKGKQVFQNTCVTCHGTDGKGDGPAAAALNPKPRNLADAKYMSGLTDEHLHTVITKGGAAVNLSTTMPAWGGALSDADVWNVIAYIRNDLCKCQPK